MNNIFFKKKMQAFGRTHPIAATKATIVLLFSLTLSALLMACLDTTSPTPAPHAVRNAAVELAPHYLGMAYEWGGQDYWWVEGGSVDCSGLIINIYKEAAERYGYALPYDDATVRNIQQEYSVAVTTAESGDVIFMGTAGEATHIALYLRTDTGRIYFIDAYSRSGLVEERSYAIDDERFLGFGRMLLVR